jgi:hypothetical protein
MKSIYDLKLHEQIEFGRYRIFRVPGGWIYTSRNLNVGCADSDVFVPFDNGFMDPTQKDIYKETIESYVKEVEYLGGNLQDVGTLKKYYDIFKKLLQQ